MTKQNEFDERKYVVFKREDLDEVLHRLYAGKNEGFIRSFGNEVRDAELDDAVVIRIHDRFASTAFYAYAGAAMATMESLSEIGQLTEEQEAWLHQLVDGFSGFGDRARRSVVGGASKVPTQ